MGTGRTCLTPRVTEALKSVCVGGCVCVYFSTGGPRHREADCFPAGDISFHLFVAAGSRQEASVSLHALLHSSFFFSSFVGPGVRTRKLLLLHRMTLNAPLPLG